MRARLGMLATKLGWAFGLAIAVPCSAFGKAPEVLRLEVFPVAAIEPMEVHSMVTNIGKEPVTIPTTTYSGDVSGWTQGGEVLGIIFAIGYTAAGKRRLVPAASRFHPVVLHPGDSTELPLVHSKRRGEKSVEVLFVVQEDFAKRHGWWHGTLKTTVEIGLGENPYYEPLPAAEVDHPTTDPSESGTPKPGTKH